MIAMDGRGLRYPEHDCGAFVIDPDGHDNAVVRHHPEDCQRIK